MKLKRFLRLERDEPDPFGYLPPSARPEPEPRHHEDYNEWRARLLEQYDIPNTLHLEELATPGGTPHGGTRAADTRPGADILWAEDETPPLGYNTSGTEATTREAPTPPGPPEQGPPTAEVPVVRPAPSNGEGPHPRRPGDGDDVPPEPSSLPVHQRMSGFWGAPQFLASHERMVVCVRPTGLALVERLVHPILALLGAIFALWLSSASELGWLSLVGLVLLIYAAVKAILRVTRWLTEYWVITPRRLLRVNGLVRRNSTTVNLTQLTAVSYKESVLQRMFREGEVELHGRDVPEEMQVIRSLPKPKWLHDVLQALADPHERERVSEVLPPVDEGALLRPGTPLPTTTTSQS